MNFAGPGHDLIRVDGLGRILAVGCLVRSMRSYGEECAGVHGYGRPIAGPCRARSRNAGFLCRRSVTPRNFGRGEYHTR